LAFTGGGDGRCEQGVGLSRGVRNVAVPRRLVAMIQRHFLVQLSQGEICWVNNVVVASAAGWGRLRAGCPGSAGGGANTWACSLDPCSGCATTTTATKTNQLRRALQAKQITLVCNRCDSRPHRAHRGVAEDARCLRQGLAGKPTAAAARCAGPPPPPRALALASSMKSSNSLLAARIEEQRGFGRVTWIKVTQECGLGLCMYKQRLWLASQQRPRKLPCPFAF
jgi:hypothetical protein